MALPETTMMDVCEVVGCEVLSRVFGNCSSSANGTLVRCVNEEKYDALCFFVASLGIALLPAVLFAAYLRSVARRLPMAEYNSREMTHIPDET
jgi:hypothetical protein